MARCGLAPSEFWELSPDEFYAILEACNDKYEEEYQDRWEQTRRLAFYAYYPHIDHRKNPHFKITDLWKHPWDAKRNQKKPLTKEELEELDKVLDSWGPLKT